MECEKSNVVGRIKCPVCDGSELVVYAGTYGVISGRCSKCEKIVLYDLKNMTARKHHAISR